jgi:hypothetical protein
VTIVLAFLALFYPAGAPFAPPKPCGEIVSGQMYGCADGHAYTRDREGWHDAGLFRPEPILVPALPER